MRANAKIVVMLMALASAFGGKASGEEPFHPVWIGTPSAADIAMAYPDQAMVERVEAKVVLGCSATREGSLVDCTVQSETPNVYHLGNGALLLATKFRLDPSHLPTGRISLPIRFAPEGDVPWRTLVFVGDPGRYRGLAPIGPYWPERALRLGRGGIAVMDCAVGAQDQLEHCGLAREEPDGIGFGDAALIMARRGWVKAGPIPSGDAPPDKVWRFRIVYPTRTLRDAP